MEPAGRYRNSGRRRNDRSTSSASSSAAVVTAFAMLDDVLRPKSFAGLFAAARSIGLATLGIALYRHGADYTALQSRAMMAGAIALAVYSVLVCHLLVRARLRAAPATLLSLVVWLIVAFGLLTVAGGQT
jgi:hypothetical protein